MTNNSGRLLKKNEMDKLKEVDIDEFPWLNFTAESVVFPDNPRKSVLLQKLHTKEELQTKVREAEEFKRQLAPKTKTTLPVDMTRDFLRSQEEMQLKRRRKLLDEDEAVALEIAEMTKAEEFEKRWSEAESLERDRLEKRQEIAKQEKVFSARKAEIAENAENAAVIGDEEDAEAVPLDEAPEALVAQKAQTSVNAESISSEEIEAIKDRAWTESYEAGYKAGYDAGAQAGHEEGLATGREEAHKAGYEEGYRLGEEAGVLAAESEGRRTFATLQELIGNIEHLRGEILASGRDIFLEFVKLGCEGILRAQLAASDNSLMKFFNATLEPYTDRALVNVEMHPDMVKRLKPMLDQNPPMANRVKLRENTGLQSGDFKVEAENEVVLVDIEKAVTTLVETLKKEIFENESGNATTSQKRAG